ncbi:hypothetical protein [Cypionkella sinensis]|uniref:hypothetical protein n=1 Tax=Cypionkella sinensis TaxID=1756043 RepID=UPI00363B2DBA
MIPRKPLASWQQFAQAFPLRETGFAPRAGLRDDQSVLGALPAPQRFGQDCYPFPTLWPDSDGVRPFFLTKLAPSWRLVASCKMQCIFQFASLRETVESAGRTTTKRGSSLCGNLSFFLPFSPCRWLAVCKTRLRAGWQVLRLALQSPMSLTTMPSPALSLAALQALQPAASTWACRPATDLIAANAAGYFDGQSGNPRLAVLFCAFWPEREGERADV